MAALVVVAGALHQDGLADTADGLGVRGDRRAPARGDARLGDRRLRRARPDRVGAAAVHGAGAARQPRGARRAGRRRRPARGGLHCCTPPRRPRPARTDSAPASASAARPCCSRAPLPCSSPVSPPDWAPDSPRSGCRRDRAAVGPGGPARGRRAHGRHDRRDRGGGRGGRLLCAAGLLAMRRMTVIGIGAGDPDHVTVQAIKALNDVDVFFVVQKAGERQDLVELRRQILERYVEQPAYRVVEVQDPERDRTAPGYGQAVEDWRRRRADVWEQAIRDELADGQRGAFLVWGDPALVRQHAGGDRADPGPGRAGVRVRRHPRHQQRPGAGRQAPGAAQPRRRTRAHHHRAPPGRGLPRSQRRRRRHARRRLHLQDAGTATSTSTGAPTSGPGTRCSCRAA